MGTLKNVQVIQGELNHSVIRITFNTPGQGFGGTGWAPAVANPDCTFLREISFRSADTRHAQQIAIDIKNLRATVCRPPSPPLIPQTLPGLAAAFSI